MLIISKATDYFDHFSKIYGEDNNVVLDRRVILDDIQLNDMDKALCPTLNYVLSAADHYNKDNHTKTIDIRVLVFCGKLYLLASKNNKNYSIVHYGDSIYNKIIKKENKGWHWSGNRCEIEQETSRIKFDVKNLSYWGHADLNHKDEIMKLYKHMKVPYFVINSCGWRGGAIQIDESIPNLKDIGFSTFNDSFEVYKDIVGFIITHLIESPDKAPPVEIPEKLRLEKKGFDSKTSFRGKNK